MKKLIYPLIFLMSVAMLTSCKDKIPTQEMSEAHEAISRAYQAQADKYAPELLKKAEDGLYGSHKACQSADIAKAKELAVAAKQDAEAAINASLPVAASAAATDAKAQYAEAKQLGAEEYAPDEMSSASQNIAKADELNKARSYTDSSAASADAIKDIEAAKSKTLAQAPQLNSKIKALRNELNVLKEQDTSEQFSPEIAFINDILGKAEKDINEGKIQEASNGITDAGDKINGIKSSIFSSRVQNARNDISTLRGEGGEQFAANLLKDADSLLDEGENSISSKNWQAADNSIKQAENKIAQAKTLVAKGVSEQKAIAAAKDEDEKALAEERAAAKKAAAERTAAKRAAANKAKASPDAVQSSKSGNVYIVKSRDCLWKISKKVYNNSRLWPRIYMANRDKIKDPDLIYPGQRLVIPAVSQADRKAVSRSTSGRKASSASQRSSSISKRDYSESEADNSRYDSETDDSDYAAFRKRYESSRTSASDRTDSYDDENIDRNSASGGTNNADNRSLSSSEDNTSSIKDSSNAASDRNIADYNNGNLPVKNDDRLNSEEDSLLPEGIFRENQ